MAYAALISLKQTIKRVLSSSQIPVLPTTATLICLKLTIERHLNSRLRYLKNIQLAYDEVKSLQQLFSSWEVDVDSAYRERVKAVEKEMREAAWTLENVVEVYCEAYHYWKVELKIDSFNQTVKKMKEQLSNILLPQDEMIDVKSQPVRDTSPLQVVVPIVETPGIEIIQLAYAYDELKSLQQLFTLEEANSKKVKALERHIREATCRLEDVLESTNVSNQSETMDGVVSAKKVKEEIDFFIESAKKIREEYNREEQLLPEEDHDSSTTDDDDFHEHASNMVGLEYEVSEIKDLLNEPLPDSRKVVSIEGMAGIGKTAFARQVYEDPSISSIFDCRLWVRIGIEYQLREIILDILAKLNHDNIDEIDEKGHEELAEYVRTSLPDRKYLVVLDDIWTKKAWRELSWLFPDNKTGSCILLTTRIFDVSLDADGHVVMKRFLNRKDSWYLLHRKVFVGDDSCPAELEEVGKMIAEKCEGLPLAINVVGKHLSKAEKTPEYWKKVAEEEISAIFSASDVMTKKLMLSYDHLPQHLKACFLYMGVFPQGYEIPVSELINLWCAEGFIEEDWQKNLEDIAKDYFGDLLYKNVVLLGKFSSMNTKTCKVHSTFWYLCLREARKEEFFHVMNSNANQGIESQRRLCIHNNVLFGIEEVRKTMESVANARSLLCTGRYHEYPVPQCLNFRLLRVLDALTIRFYEFPVDVVKLIYLRYLAFTYNGKLPPSISKLKNLQYLIVGQHLSILSYDARRSYLPMEIWDMKELRHLQVMGSDLPDPSSDSAVLPNLSTLLGISARSCTKKVFEKIPNLKKLGIQIELGVVDAVVEEEPLCCFHHLSLLDKLGSLKCVIVNPKVVAPPPVPVSVFKLQFLRKVSLSGLGYPWAYMSSFAELKWLQVLKLRRYAFRGPVWEAYEYEFHELKHLVLEDVDLENWHADPECFPMLEDLIIRHCYKLKEIPLEFAGIPGLTRILLVDCGDSLVASAKQIVNEQVSSFGVELTRVHVESSWENGRKRKSRAAR